MSGFKVFSTNQDLDAVFELRTAATDPSAQLVPYVTRTGQNLSDRYLFYNNGLYGNGKKAINTGFKYFDQSVNITDLKDIYTKKYSWNAMQGLSSQVNAVYALDMSNVYAGGNFAPNSTLRRIARWNGSSWLALGSGVGSGGFSEVFAVYALDVNNVYVGGSFTSIGSNTSIKYIAKWNGTAWVGVGSGVNNIVNTIHALNATNIYVGGLFTSAGGASANYIARWDGSNWNVLGTPTNGVSGSTTEVSTIYALNASNIYVGGLFTSAGGVSATNIAKWDENAQSWTNLTTGVGTTSSGKVRTIYALSTDNVYVGGDFAGVGNNINGDYRFITKWNGTDWISITLTFPYMQNAVNAIYAFDPSNVYVGGSFTNISNDTNLRQIAKWNGTTWISVGGGMGNGMVKGIYATRPNNAYAGGSFSIAGGITASVIANWG